MLQTFLPCPSASHLHGSDFAWVVWGWDLSNDSTLSGDVLKEMQFTHVKMNGTEQVTQACDSYSATAAAQWCGVRSVGRSKAMGQLWQLQHSAPAAAPTAGGSSSRSRELSVECCSDINLQTQTAAGKDIS